jgi:hypothetical protein
MSMTIEQILGLPRLLGLINETTTGLPMDKVFTSRLPGLMSITRDVIGNSGQATLTKGQRKVPKVIKYNAPPVSAPLETIATRDWVMLASSEVITIDPITYQQMGAEEIGRQTKLFKQKFRNMELCCITNALVRGAIYLDADGNFLPTSSGAAETLDIGVPATHKNQLDGIITIPWSNPNANIPKNIQDIKSRAAKDTGYIPSVCIYGASIPTYLMQNQYVQTYQNKVSVVRDTYVMDNEISDGYLGIDKWVNGSTFFFEDEDGVNQSLVPDDAVIFFPEVDREWYEFWQGSTLIPTTLNILPGNDNDLQANTRLVYGMYLYAHLDMRPINYELVGGTVFWPGIKNPDVLFQADVNF